MIDWLEKLLHDKFPRFAGQCPAVEHLGTVGVCCTEVKWHGGCHTFEEAYVG